MKINFWETDLGHFTGGVLSVGILMIVIYLYSHW